MGPADQITSHMYAFGIRGKQFQFVEGQLPKGVKFHGRLTDHDVRQIQESGARIVVLEPKFTGADLAEARKGCITNSAPVATVQEAPAASAPLTAAAPQGNKSNNSVTSLNQQRILAREPASKPITDANAPSPQVQPTALAVENHESASQDSSTAAIRPAANSAGEGTASITSSPDGADIFVDSIGRGRTPLILKLPAGRHSVQLAIEGYRDWVQSVDVKSASVVNITASLGK
jgi:PEGA domain